jgi:predicted ribosome quality control (RQC) complex YloA/Tae2 family protein
MKILEYNNVKLLLGQNAKENHLLIDNADPNDWWFHIDNSPSGHCIVESININNELILQAATFVKDNSKVKNNKKIKIIYTQIKNIKKTKNPGEVILLNKPNEILI